MFINFMGGCRDAACKTSQILPLAYIKEWKLREDSGNGALRDGLMMDPDHPWDWPIYPHWNYWGG